LTPVTNDTGVIGSQKIVSRLLTRRMNTGSPCTEAHELLTVSEAPLFSVRLQASADDLAAL